MSRPEVTLFVDDERVVAEEGEPVAAILLRHPPFFTRTTPVSASRRAPFCMMGICFDCMVELDGQPSTRSCLVRAREGMRIVRQRGRPSASGEDRE